MKNRQPITQGLTSRRSFLSALSSLAALAPLMSVPSKVFAANNHQPFSMNTVFDLAKGRAGQPYQPRPPIPQSWRNLDYVGYRDIQFLDKAGLWKNEETAFELQFFAPGFIHKTSIDVSIVENGIATAYPFNPDQFNIGPKAGDLTVTPDLGYSGFRIHNFINSDKHKTEFAVFQGASYFRAVAAHQFYGLSARGLAVDTAEPTGEEFPDFQSFWIEKPAPGATTVTVHALMDSPRITGAFKFDFEPGEITRCAVDCTLFAREDIANIGIAPLTSMFLFDGKQTARFDDFRPNVHDSDGLLMANAAGEWLWRPLANPHHLQVSAFADTAPKGFGLMQRKRQFSSYQDTEVHYERRPGAWIRPRGNWGRGSVTLVEIPTQEEIQDNIVAYWRPENGLAPTANGHQYSYDLFWTAEVPEPYDLAKVRTTRGGAHLHGGRIVTIEFDPHEETEGDLAEIIADAYSTPGTALKNTIVGKNPETGGIRVGLIFNPEDNRTVEFRLRLRKQNHPVSETWLYRWTV